MKTDTERLDWLEKEVNMGGALVGVVHNDSRHWAVLWDGMQNLDEEMCEGSENKPFPLNSVFFAGPDDLHRFKLTAREAIDYAMENIP